MKCTKCAVTNAKMRETMDGRSDALAFDLCISLHFLFDCFVHSSSLASVMMFAVAWVRLFVRAYMCVCLPEKESFIFLAHLQSFYPFHLVRCAHTKFCVFYRSFDISVVVSFSFQFAFILPLSQKMKWSFSCGPKIAGNRRAIEPNEDDSHKRMCLWLEISLFVYILTHVNALFERITWTAKTNWTRDERKISGTK